MDTGQSDRTNGAENVAQTAKPAKKGRKNGSSSLLKATQLLGDALGHLTGFPDLQQNAANIREQVLNTLLDHERRAGVS